jgi:hypothetical protein
MVQTRGLRRALSCMHHTMPQMLGFCCFRDWSFVGRSMPVMIKYYLRGGRSACQSSSEGAAATLERRGDSLACRTPQPAVRKRTERRKIG